MSHYSFFTGLKPPNSFWAVLYDGQRSTRSTHLSVIGGCPHGRRAGRRLSTGESDGHRAAESQCEQGIGEATWWQTDGESAWRRHTKVAVGGLAVRNLAGSPTWAGTVWGLEERKKLSWIWRPRRQNMLRST